MKNKAFTLAEVLITLGIIGIVAAMTLPAVINKIQNKDKSAKLKKFYSTLNQAILRSSVDNGDPEGWINNLKYHNAEALYEWFEQYIMKYMVDIKNCRNGNVDCAAGYTYCNKPGQCTSSSTIIKNYVLYMFSDGSMIVSLTGGNPDSEGITQSLILHILFDTNGYSKPNTFGQDIFSFRVLINNNQFKMTCDAGAWSKDRDWLLSSCKNEPQTCSCLLMYSDNWEFKKDYPW